MTYSRRYDHRRALLHHGFRVCSRCHGETWFEAGSDWNPRIEDCRCDGGYWRDEARTQFKRIHKVVLEKAS